MVDAITGEASALDAAPGNGRCSSRAVDTIPSGGKKMEG